MTNKVKISVTLTKTNESIVEISTIEKDAAFETFLMQLEASLISSAKIFNTLISEIKANMPITAIFAMAHTYILAEERPELMVILQAYNRAVEKEDKIINLELSSAHGKRIVKIPVHQILKPMYN